MPHGVEYAFQWGLFPAFKGQRLHLDELLEGFGAAPESRGECLLEIDQDARSVRLINS
jgi:hypothetical protein